MNRSVLEDKVRERKLLEASFDEDMMCWSKGMLQKYNKLMAYYRCAIMEVETKFNVLNEEFSLRYDRNPISGINIFMMWQVYVLFVPSWMMCIFWQMHY